MWVMVGGADLLGSLFSLLLLEEIRGGGMSVSAVVVGESCSRIFSCIGSFHLRQTVLQAVDKDSDDDDGMNALHGVGWGRNIHPRMIQNCSGSVQQS